MINNLQGEPDHRVAGAETFGTDLKRLIQPRAPPSLRRKDYLPIFHAFICLVFVSRVFLPVSFSPVHPIHPTSHRIRHSYPAGHGQTESTHKPAHSDPPRTDHRDSLHSDQRAYTPYWNEARDTTREHTYRRPPPYQPKMSLEVGSLPSPTGPFHPNHNLRSPSFEARGSYDTSNASKVSMASRFKDLVRVSAKGKEEEKKKKKNYPFSERQIRAKQPGTAAGHHCIGPTS